MSLRRRVDRARASSAVVRCVLLVSALAVAGCASDDEYRREAYAQAHAMRATPQVRQQPQEMEDDGLPPQVPPPVNRRREPDDPREPYSPNYGKTGAIPQGPQRAALATTPPAAPRHRTVAF